MGGAKKKSAAQQEKTQESKGEQKRSKREKKEEGTSQKAEIVVTLTEETAAKVLKSSKAITVQDLARQTGVKMSAANTFLRQALKDGKIKRVAGYSGHHIYVSA